MDGMARPQFQFSLLSLLMLMTAAAFVAWGWPFIVPPAIAIVRGGDWKVLAVVVVGIIGFSLWIVRQTR